MYDDSMQNTIPISVLRSASAKKMGPDMALELLCVCLDIHLSTRPTLMQNLKGHIQAI